MKTLSPWTRHATLLTALTLLTVPVLAAPHLDPKVVGHWHGSLPGQHKGAGQMDIRFRADGTETLIVSAPKQNFAVKAAYVTKPGMLVMTMISATNNGKPAPKEKPQALKYKVEGNTLILDDGTPNGHATLHRVKS